ncbi:MAG: site-specific DNA-methyltransferase [Bacteroidales bacterium]|nr:site-specific DNA-methyltransferase [Bacteroidales bacterium]HOK39339.1 site-specific DNA-methyltransferase [Bacteroidales bacterium]HUM33594.1 site-specific DNA-methyltransferase [Bacteroidales bacterium]
MHTKHTLIFGNSISMIELPDESIHLIVTSPPYFNAPFDYKNLFKSYEQYLGVIEKVAKESFRVLKEGRIFALNIDDMLVDGKKYPITADATKIFQHAGFTYRDRIVWKKPDGYLRISKRSGVLLQNPYPMYFYPDNLLESIIIFQKGKFKYSSISKEIKEKSKIDIKEFQKNNWHRTLWEMTNVLPGSELEKGIAAFPDELPYRIIKLFSYIGETVLDPFLGSGTTMKVANLLHRNSIGIEIIRDLENIIRSKIDVENLEIIERNKGKYRYVTLEYINKKMST